MSFSYATKYAYANTKELNFPQTQLAGISKLLIPGMFSASTNPTIGERTYLFSSSSNS
jgi:hypothetical protein